MTNTTMQGTHGHVGSVPVGSGQPITLRTVRDELQGLAADVRAMRAITRCRYVVRASRSLADAEICTGEAVEPDAEIHLCLRHLGAAMELINRRMQ